jgi:hypothetical protein
MPEHAQTLLELLACQECRTSWVDSSERWRMYVMPDEPDAPTLLYCPTCAGREFDAD